jgi:hypothetical protein
MSQRDLVAELHAARTPAPEELRERVRLVAASAPPPARRVTWRRAVVVALPVAAAIAAAVVLGRPAPHHAATRTLGHLPPVQHGATWTTASPPVAAGKNPADIHAYSLQGKPDAAAAGARPAPQAALTVPVPQGRAARVDAYLALRVATASDVSDDVKRAVRVAISLGGYASSVHASTAASTGVADLTLKVPRGNVGTAIQRLAQVGRITAESVDVQDVQAGINATDRRIAKLQAQLAALRAEPQTPSVTRKSAALTVQVQALQRSEHATLRSVADATISLHLQTKQRAVLHHRHHGHGPLHGLGVAFRWIGIGLVYVLALGVPLALLVALVWLAARAVRRRRDEALLAS